MPHIVSLAETVVRRCRALAQWSDQPGQTVRTFLSPAMRGCMQTVQGWMEQAGLSVTVDAAGNLRGIYPGVANKRLIIGSHLDTVPNAGAFDGVLGVMIALALIEALAGERLPFAMEVIAFSEEEGVRHRLPFIGSRALAGTLDAAMLKAEDAAGISVAGALTACGLDPGGIPGCRLDADAAAFLEFHIEQGVVLESEHKPLGVVEAIAGQTRAQIVFTGLARHAGTTPMHLRHDAVAAAAEWITEVERTALATTGLAATVGDVRAFPGAGNVIAGECRVTLDLRHQHDDVRQQAFTHLLQRSHTIAGRRGLTAGCDITMDQAAVPLDPRLTALAAGAVRDTGLDPLTMVSGAGHDSMILAPCVPTTMIFLRSPGGISHHPDETVTTEDVACALSAGLAFLRRFTLFESGPNA